MEPNLFQKTINRKIVISLNTNHMNYSSEMELVNMTGYQTASF